MKRTYIIAEAGVNHNGEIDLARILIDEAALAGADAVKFQTFKGDRFISGLAEKTDYQKEATGHSETQLEMIRKLELDRNAHEILIAHCQDKGIEFLSTPFDDESIELLFGFGIPRFKIPSGEINNLPYLRKIGSLGRDIILSTGMANLGEIEYALDVLVTSGAQRDKITLLHCTTAYPTPFEDVNLTAIHTLAHAFPGSDIGYSDHTLGFEATIAAVAMGASVVEKHFTLDRNLVGPDHKSSIEAIDFKNMVDAIRNIEIAMGDGIKRTRTSEEKNKEIVRKSIVAMRNIEAGEICTEENITTKRPGTGLPPTMWDEVIGKRATRSYKKDDFISL